MAMLINGKEIAAEIRREIAVSTETFKKENGYAPNTQTNVETNDATGYLYQLFIENF